MLFSFLVPVYNTSKYLDQCMDSLLCQKGADFEIVLINDGSTDNSGEICDRYANEYPHIVRVVHKENEGSLMTRRRGFKEIKGDWIICIDSDDYVAEELLESVVTIIEKHNCDVVMYNYSYVYADGTVVKSKLCLDDNSIFEGEQKQILYKKRLLSEEINMLWLRAFRRDLLDLDIDYSKFGVKNLCDDALQILPLLTNSQKTVFVDKTFYYYRKGENSITSKLSKENWESIKNCFLATEIYLDIWDVSEELRRKFYTYNTETLSNYLRWVFVNNKPNINKEVCAINSHSAFDRCMKMYDKKYAKTSYLKFSVPIIMRLVEKGRIRLLMCILRLEGVFYRLRSRL